MSTEKVFVNRTLNLKKINYIGFDMDHTLVRYQTYNFEKLAHHKILEKLVGDKGYPEKVLGIPFEFERIIRGLVLDCSRGNLLKLNRHSSIRLSYHGTRKIPFHDQKSFYRGEMVDLSNSNYLAVDTAFSISSGGVFARLVDLKDEEPDSLPSYEEMAHDVIHAIDMAHRDGSLKDEVRDNLDHYIQVDRELPPMLERYRKHDKKLFLLTNSDYHYTRLLLDYAITPYLKETEHWSDLFEFVITLATKPRYFYDKLRLFHVDAETGQLTNVEGGIEPGIYQGGCASHFTESLGLDGDDILYVGDHIYGDILRLKKDCSWRTVLVIEELEDEISRNRRALPIHDRISELMVHKEIEEREVVRLHDRVKEHGDEDCATEIEGHMETIAHLDNRIGELIQQHQKVFNPYWGEVMRIGNEESYFAGQVDRYACVYASKLSDLLSLSPRTYFRTHRRKMPHE